MIIPDRKKAATVIVARLHHPEEDTEMRPEDHVGSDETGGELHGIARDLIQGVHGGSPESVVAALTAFFRCLEDEEHEEGEI